MLLLRLLLAAEQFAVSYGFSAQGQTIQTGTLMEGSQVISNPYASSTHIQYNARQTGHAPLQLTASNYGAREGFAHRTTAGLSICQFILGVTAISLGVAAIIIKCELSHIGTGIWCGAFFSMTGIIGIISAAKNKTGAIIAFMVLSIISASVFAACLFVICIVAATREYNCLYCRNPEGRLVVDLLLVGVAVAEAVVAIVASAICCRAVCCNRSQKSMYSIPIEGQTVQHRAPMEQSNVTGNPYASSGSTKFHRRQIDHSRVMQQQVYTIPSPTVPQNIGTPTSQQGTSPAVQQPQPMQFQQKSQQHPMLQQPAWQQRQQPAQSPMSPQQSQQFEQRGTLQYPQHVQQPTKLQLQQPQSQPLHLQQSPPQQQPPPMQRTQPQLLQRPPSQPLQSQQSPVPPPLSD
ncbi:uncharacterized protein [Ptychodera flava]|uniref:uncharacterized protein n=1 Tax=Ptychodera flava TaxID=63121 RepID=UPI00396A7572